MPASSGDRFLQLLEVVEVTDADEGKLNARQ